MPASNRSRASVDRLQSATLESLERADADKTTGFRDSWAENLLRCKPLYRAGRLAVP